MSTTSKIKERHLKLAKNSVSSTYRNFCLITASFTVWSLFLIVLQTFRMSAYSPFSVFDRTVFTYSPPLPRIPPWISAANQTTSADLLYIHNRLAELPGCRLGNQLFFYATLFGTAWNCPRHIPIWPHERISFIRPAFPSLRIPFDVGNNIIASPDFRPVSVPMPIYEYAPDALENLTDSNITLAGYMLTSRYFDHVETELRRDFTFNDDIATRARNFINASTPAAWIDTDIVRVVIHIRRGDLAPKSEADTIIVPFPAPTFQYFNRSMSYFERRFPRVLFVVLSDDIEWCRNNLVPGRTNVVYSSGNSPHVDLAIASLCDHAIITVGTYSWWVAWFADGLTITLNHCKANASMESRHRQLTKRLEAFYKPEWIRFERC